MQKFFTIGMAGHIDHGKTSLTKALTGVDTDRLKEEKERNISIEPGFALLTAEEGLKLSIIDVPGHERFIRQMIAGVAGVDIVVLVVSADEGVMPQTREHVHILSLLGMKKGVVALTKADLVDEDFLEMVKEDLQAALKGTFLEGAPYFVVDSKSKRGIDSFKEALIDMAKQMEKKISLPSFRLPIDHVFTVQGQGTVVRGTVFSGEVKVGDEVLVLPQEERARVRQIQSHHQTKEKVEAGERVALNLGGIPYDDLRRGDVLVKDRFFETSTRVDLALTTVPLFEHRIKQRQIVKLYLGTAEVIGRIIFYDRRELEPSEGEEILCQVELEEPIVVTRGDRFILRRASPTETIGGGWVIQAKGERRKFGEESLSLLSAIKEGKPRERVDYVLTKLLIGTKEALQRQASVSEEEWKKIEDQYLSIDRHLWTNQAVLDKVQGDIVQALTIYHERYPLRLGQDKAELLSSFETSYPKELLAFALEVGVTEGLFTLEDQFVALASFSPEVPSPYKDKMAKVYQRWEKDGAEVSAFSTYLEEEAIDPSLWQDLYYFTLQTKRGYIFDEGRLIHRQKAVELAEKLFQQTKGQPFSLQLAREVFGLSRKNLIPLLELFDALGLTKRVEQERVWLIEGKEELSHV